MGNVDQSFEISEHITLKRDWLSQNMRYTSPSQMFTIAWNLKQNIP
jgi:hypothetical protein